MTKRTVLALIALAIFATREAQGQTPKPGVGYIAKPGMSACFVRPSSPTRCFPIDPSIRPWGPTGTGQLDHGKFLAAYFQGGEDIRRQGYWPLTGGEWVLNMPTALRHAWEHRSSLLDNGGAGYSGVPTDEESWLWQVTQPLCGPGNAMHLAPAAEGGRDHPIRITEERFHFYRRQVEAERVCALGELQTPRPVCPGQWGPLHWIVEWLPADRPWCATTPPPPPPPAPQPPPATSCPAGQTCQAPRPECPEPDPPAECPSVLKEIGALALALLDGVRWAILPDGRATKNTDGRYIFVSRTEETRLRNQAARAAVAGDCYLPGVPSTGRAGVELVPGERP